MKKNKEVGAIEVEFAKTWIALGGEPYSWDLAWKYLCGLYGDYGRTYHNINHLRFVIRVANTISREENHVVKMALFYHDAAPPAKPQAVGKSANIFYDFAKEYDLSNRDEIMSLILFTDYERDPKNDNEVLVNDSDLAVLASPWKEFNHYDLSIRAEYSDVPRGIFIQERIKVLKRFLEKEKIFFTPGCSLWNSHAKDNLSRVIVEYENNER